MIECKDLEPKFLVSKSNEAHARTFLNSPDSDHTGSIKAEISVRKKRHPKSSKKKGFYFSIWGGIEIRDCDKRIDLTLDGGTKNPERLQELQNTKNKLHKIIAVCQQILDNIEIAEKHKDFK